MSSQQKIICYGSTGTRFGNNTKCPDSDSCCQTVEQCRPDRLCVSNKDSDTLVRAPCSANPWNDNCAKVCIEGESAVILEQRKQRVYAMSWANGSQMNRGFIWIPSTSQYMQRRQLLLCQRSNLLRRQAWLFLER